MDPATAKNKVEWAQLGCGGVALVVEVSSISGRHGGLGSREIILGDEPNVHSPSPISLLLKCTPYLLTQDTQTKETTTPLLVQP